MDVSIQSTEEKQLLGRTDYTVRVFSGGATPSRSAVLDALAKQLKAKKELLVIRSINTVFGQPASLVKASVYTDEKMLHEFESAHIKERHAKIADKKAAEAAAEAAQKEAPDKAAEEKADDAEKPADEPKKEGDA